MKIKKIITMVAVFTMAMSVTACGQNQENSQEDAENAVEAETESDAVLEEETDTEIVNQEDELKSEIETAVGEFEYACQTSDVNAMLDCLDPGFSQSLKSGRLLLNWMSTENNSDEIIMDTMLIAVMNISDIAVDVSTMDIEINEINVSNDVATVDALITLESSDEPYRDKIVIHMSKENGKWYINGVTT